MTLKLRRQASKGPNPEPAVATPATNGADGHGNSVVLGPQDRLIGQLYIEGDLRVTGTVEGELEATGNIEISGAGKVSGTVTAYNRLVVGSEATLIGGDVRVARLTVEDGATFTGKVSMGKQAAAEPKPAEPEPAPVTEPMPAATPVAVIEPVVEPKAKPKKR